MDSIFNDSSGSPDSAGVLDALNTYASSINHGDATTAYAVLSPPKGSLDSFAAGVQSSQITNGQITSVRSAGSGRKVVEARFTSTQDPDKGFHGQACSKWQMTYTMAEFNGGWRIDSAKPHAGSPTDCSGSAPTVEAAPQPPVDSAPAQSTSGGTVSQQNAYKSAVSYLSFEAFSRSGLIKQLTSKYGESFPAADAEYAVKRLEREGAVNWNAEAAKAAKSYLNTSSFSHAGLVQQLTSQYGDGFTRAQAEYGVKQAGL